MGRQDKYIERQLRVELGDGCELFSQRASIGFVAHDRDIAGDARKYLIACDDRTILMMCMPPPVTIC